MLSDDFVSVFFSSKVPEFLHMVFNYIEKHHPVFFSAGLLFVFEKGRMQKILRSIAVSFGDLLLHEKQKKFFCFAFVLLNNEINEASL